MTTPIVNSTSTHVVTDIATSTKTVTSAFTKSKTITVRLPYSRIVPADQNKLINL